MDYLTTTRQDRASFVQSLGGVEAERAARQVIREVWRVVEPKLVALVASFLEGRLSPATFFRFELALAVLLRQLGRELLAMLLNSLEPQERENQIAAAWFECGLYRCRPEKTANRHVASLFGTLTLWRVGYRSWEGNDRGIFPLEMLLGLVEGVTPALADRIGRAMADAGATQGRVLKMLAGEHDVKLGAARLRKLTVALSQGLAEYRQSCQVDALLAALKLAVKSSGSRKPVLSVGRDGITLREHRHGCFEVATAATVSVYDRRGKRLTTVYLAWPPELGQATMTAMLTALLTDLLSRWKGPLPQLAYVADCGDHETSFFDNTLRRMTHPHTRKRLHWQRVVDYYHVAERIWTMADCLFGQKTREGQAWARRMLKAIKKPSGTSRVLHSAASVLARRQLSASATKEFRKAYRYIRQRTRFMRYHEYAGKNIPLGSGVTEAACKTIFTQRLKLSGMRWSRRGAEIILTLRTIYLSNTWEATFAKHLDTLFPSSLAPYAKNEPTTLKIAA